MLIDDDPETGISTLGLVTVKKNCWKGTATPFRDRWIAWPKAGFAQTPNMF